MTKTTRALAGLGAVAVLSLAALPLSTYAAAEKKDQDVEVYIDIEDALEMTVDSESVELTLSGTGISGIYRNDTALKISVETTHASGYKLTMVGSSDGDTPTSLYNESQTEIKTGAFSEGTDIDSTWGYLSSDSDWSWGSSFEAIPSTAKELASSTKSAAQDTYVQFDAYIKPGQEAGHYTGQVTFSATPNAS